MSSKNTKTTTLEETPAGAAPEQPSEQVVLTTMMTNAPKEKAVEAVPPTDESIEARIKELLLRPKKSGQLLTMSRYKVGPNRYYYFEYDVDGDAYEQAWNLFRAEKGDNEPEFIQLVNQILDASPRMHRGISYKPLS